MTEWLTKCVLVLHCLVLLSSSAWHETYWQHQQLFKYHPSFRFRLSLCLSLSVPQSLSLSLSVCLCVCVPLCLLLYAYLCLDLFLFFSLSWRRLRSLAASVADIARDGYQYLWVCISLEEFMDVSYVCKDWKCCWFLASVIFMFWSSKRHKLTRCITVISPDFSLFESIYVLPG